MKRVIKNMFWIYNWNVLIFPLKKLFMVCTHLYFHLYKSDFVRSLLLLAQFICGNAFYTSFLWFKEKKRKKNADQKKNNVYDCYASLLTQLLNSKLNKNPNVTIELLFRLWKHDWSLPVFMSTIKIPYN